MNRFILITLLMFSFDVFSKEKDIKHQDYPLFLLIYELRTMGQDGELYLMDRERDDKKIISALKTMTKKKLKIIHKLDDQLHLIEYKLKNISEKQIKSVKKVQVTTTKMNPIYGSFLSIEDLTTIPLASNYTKEDVLNNISCVIDKDKGYFEEAISLVNELKNTLELIDDQYNSHQQMVLASLFVEMSSLGENSLDVSFKCP